MKSWTWIAIALACLLGPGCQHHRNTAALEQELRLYEDRIYQLQDCLQRTQTALEESRRENAAMQAQPFHSPPSETPSTARPKKLEPPLPEDFHLDNPGQEGFKSNLPDSLKVPDPGISPPSDTGPELPDDRTDTPPATTDPNSPAPGWNPSTKPPGTDPTSDSGQPEEISLGEVVAAARDASGQMTPGEGLTMVVQPRDASGRLIAVEGPVSAVLIDPSVTGPAARVARWDFPAEEVARGLRRSGPSPGFLLSMPWPEGPPQSTDLHLHIRYTTPDGRRLETDRSIRLRHPEPSDPASTLASRDENTRVVFPAAERRKAAISPRRRRPIRPLWSPERP
ncbi:MAG: hypothetical protein JW818_22635 [Pirellulales bacterium]|nr:hypothetical protein [Pirellulales bacterium]